jgi:amino acid adenylation domain-containing protein
MSSVITHNLHAGEHSKIVPASSYQEGLWLLNQFHSESTINTLSATVHIRHDLNSASLQNSLNLLIERYELLRTTFRLEAGQLVQVIAPRQTFPLTIHNLHNIAQEQQQARVRDLAREQALIPFNTEQGPLLRASLVQLSTTHSLLLLTLHRLIADDWTVSLLTREIANLYEADAKKATSALPPVSNQYADFIRTQEQAQTEEALAEHLAYWKQQIEDAPSVLPLPTDHPRPATTSWRGGTVQTVLPTSLVQDLRVVSQQQQVHLHATLLAAFATLLARYTNQQDLLLGALVPARRSPEHRELLGPCDNTLVLRPNFEGDPAFLEFMTRSRDLLNASLEHEMLPFDTLLKAVRPAGSLNSTPLIQVLLHLPWELPSLPEGWMLQPVESGVDTAEFDLALDLHQSSEGLICRFNYSTDLFDQTTIERMSQHWQTLLESVVTNPNLSLSRLPILPAAERRQLLEEWTATDRVYPLQQSYAELFEAQVARTPQAIAAAYEVEQVNYDYLNRQANVLAHQLREYGVGPDTLVSLLAERGIPVLVSILGIFKAGGGYLPLDPHHPPTRQRYFIEQSRTPLILCTKKLEHQIIEALEETPEEKRPRYLLIEDLLAEEQCTPERQENPPLQGTPDSLAYVIYTSGSTGLPKGAILERKGMLNHLFGKIDALQLTADDIVIQTASQCFDISVWQLLAVLLVGGRVQICPDDITQDPELLLREVEKKRVSILETVPSWLRAMLDTAESTGQSNKAPNLTTLRWMVPTGEALPVELSRRWLQRYPNIPLLNAYGPTECSDDVTHYVVAEPPAEGMSNMPIGTALPNMRIYVLDRHLQPQPIGVSGEICVGGVGVGRGYLDNEKKTREAFVPDPFSGVEGTHLYKTGDLGRFLPDGNLEFQGRVDFQVKIRGYRIELGEIEAVLNQHPSVREAVVLAREDQPGHKQLVAYIELKKGQTVTVDDLRNLTKQHLAPYMEPRTFMIMEQFPLTSNGKLDRKALPVPEWNLSEKAEGYVAPTTPLEQQLVTICEELLGVSPIGIRDNFFYIGGDSLMAARFFDRIGQTIGKKIPLSVFFAGATIENVARALQQDEPQEEAQLPKGLVAVQKGGSKRPFFYLHGEWKGGAFYTQDIAKALGSEQPFYLMDPYPLGESEMPPSMEEVAASHIEMMRSVQPEGPYQLGGYCNGALVAYEIARQLHAAGQKVDLLLLIDPDAPAQERWLLRLLERAGAFTGMDRKRQLEAFFFIGHVYRYARFPRYRHRYLAELLGMVDPDESNHEAGSKLAAASMAASFRLKLLGLLPDMKKLLRGNAIMYDWLVANYAPALYPGEITFFWTSEEPWRPVGWQSVMKAKRWDIETYTLPGNHITSRTTYLPVLIEHIRTCIDQAQEQ